jgi:nitrogen fixation NifU-like protein
LLIDALSAKQHAVARELFEQFHDMITSDPGSPITDLGKLSVLAGVRDYPTRVKCASLAWHTMKAAVAHESNAPVSTE